MPAVKKTKFMELFWKIHPWLYEISGGRIGGNVFGMPVLVLMTHGRKSGLLRKNTLMYVPKGDACVVIASNAGEPKHPAWYLNLRAKPNVQVRRGNTVTSMVARDAEGGERAALWKEIVETESGYAEYEQRTSRKIPVVVLDPA